MWPGQGPSGRNRPPALRRRPCTPGRRAETRGGTLWHTAHTATRVAHIHRSVPERVSPPCYLGQISSQIAPKCSKMLQNAPKLLQISVVAVRGTMAQGGRRGSAGHPDGSARRTPPPNFDTADRMDYVHMTAARSQSIRERPRAGRSHEGAPGSGFGGRGRRASPGEPPWLPHGEKNQAKSKSRIRRSFFPNTDRGTLGTYNNVRDMSTPLQGPRSGLLLGGSQDSNYRRLFLTGGVASRGICSAPEGSGTRGC